MEFLYKNLILLFSCYRNVIRNCAIHGTGAERNSEERRDSASVRKSSSSSLDNSKKIDQWRRSSYEWDAAPTSSQDISPTVSYQSNQIVNKKQSRQVSVNNTHPSLTYPHPLLYSFKRYASFRNSLNEILYEEDEEEAEEQETKDNQPSTVPFSFRLGSYYI